MTPNDDDGEDEDDEEWRDEENDYEYDEEEVERSVLLFNTWADDGPPPMGVTGDYATGALPEGIELSKGDAAAFLQSQEARLLKEWQEDYGQNRERLRCNPRHEWSNVEIQSVAGSDSACHGHVLNVSLMGNQKRRLHPEKYVALTGPINSTEKAFDLSSEVSKVKLRPILPGDDR